MCNDTAMHDTLLTKQCKASQREKNVAACVPGQVASLVYKAFKKQNINTHIINSRKSTLSICRRKTRKWCRCVCFFVYRKIHAANRGLSGWLARRTRTTERLLSDTIAYLDAHLPLCSRTRTNHLGVLKMEERKIRQNLRRECRTKIWGIFRNWWKMEVLHYPSSDIRRLVVVYFPAVMYFPFVVLSWSPFSGPPFSVNPRPLVGSDSDVHHCCWPRYK